jgi:single-strand DNA-binding protein
VPELDIEGMRRQGGQAGEGEQGGGQQGGQWGANPQQGGRPAQEDPWASSNPQGGGGWGSPANDEPPF